MTVETPRLTTLAESLAPLDGYFTRTLSKPRFVAILSPTCPGCKYGATAIRRVILDGFPSTDLAVALIWIPMLGDDTADAIEHAAAEFADYDVTQFVDSNRLAGRRIAESVGADDGIAWDSYLFYVPDARWAGGSPEPTKWVHQLAVCSWVPAERQRCGADLASALGQLAHRMVQQNDSRRPL